MRNFFLFLSKNKTLTRAAKKYGLKFGAARFVAGDTLEQAIQVIKEMNDKGLAVTIDYLGEFVDNETEANIMVKNAIEAIKAIAQYGLNSQVSLKLTSMGLDLSDELVLENMQKIMNTAEENHVFITIDMEDFTRCQKTLDMFKHLKIKYENVGTVIQAYLYRTKADMVDLEEYSPNLRLVKGAYKESTKVAFPEKADVDNNFKEIIKIHLLNGHYTAIATHDDMIIDFVKKFVKNKAIPKEQFEFQMLYGIRPEQQIELVEQGYKMRVYIPYGTDWYGYFMRRLAERPANVMFVLKGIFTKK